MTTASLADRAVAELRLSAGNPVAERLGPDQAVAAATALFLAHRRVDMQELAASLGVGRATLYRWFGDRERLLGLVLWSLSEQALVWLAAEVRGSARHRVLTAVEAFMTITCAFPPLRHFLASEPSVALRALLGDDSPLITELTGWATAFLTEHVVDDEPAELAQVLVSVTSTFCWARIVAGVEPDIDSAMRAVRVLLR